MRGSTPSAADPFRRPMRGERLAYLVALGLVLLASGSPLAAGAVPLETGVAAIPPGGPTAPDGPDGPDGKDGRDGASGKGRLLVASPGLVDPNFAETVVLLLEGGTSGAIGVVVNRPSKLELRSVLPDVKGLTDRADTVFLGGPVERSQLLLLVRAATPPKDSLRVFEDVFVTASMEALSRAAEERSREVRFRLFAGYAGWGPGQLEMEIARGDWLIAPGDVERVFAAAPERIWSELVERESGRWVRNDRPIERTGAILASARTGL
jgi:putative transcriptional regulator